MTSTSTGTSRATFGMSSQLPSLDIHRQDIYTLDLGAYQDGT
jgi:hypothetical protein